MLLPMILEKWKILESRKLKNFFCIFPVLKKEQKINKESQLRLFRTDIWKQEFVISKKFWFNKKENSKFIRQSKRIILSTTIWTNQSVQPIQNQFLNNQIVSFQPTSNYSQCMKKTSKWISDPGNGEKNNFFGKQIRCERRIFIKSITTKSLY